MAGAAESSVTGPSSLKMKKKKKGGEDRKNIILIFIFYTKVYIHIFRGYKIKAALKVHCFVWYCFVTQKKKKGKQKNEKKKETTILYKFGFVPSTSKY